MRIKTIILSILFVLVISVDNITAFADDTNCTTNSASNTNSEYDKSFDIIFTEYSKMINCFAYDCVYNKKTRTLDANHHIAEIDIDYPSNYAGACYNANGDGKIDIYLTNDETDSYEKYYESNQVSFHKVDYSLNELIEVKDIISTYLYDYNIACVGIYQKDNRVKVSYIEGFSKRSFDELLDSRNINKDLIEFEKTDKIIGTSITIPSGSSIHINTNPIATVGFNAYKPSTGQYGIVTAGHLLSGATNSTSIKDSSDRTINTRGASSVCNNNNDNVDCAFIPFNSSYDWRKTTRYSNSGYTGYIIGSYYVNSTLEGTPVVKYGATTGRRSGNIICTSCNVLYTDDLYKYDYIMCSNYNQEGDSGGPIGIESNHKLRIVALTCSRDNEGNTFACKVTNVYGKLGINMCYK